MPALLKGSRYFAHRGGHATGDVRDAFLEAIDVFENQANLNRPSNSASSSTHRSAFWTAVDLQRYLAGPGVHWLICWRRAAAVEGAAQRPESVTAMTPIEVA
jgi:hypothetical protein